MKYLATIKFGTTDSWTQSFESRGKAEQWLDEQNNNLEHTTIICEYDEKGKLKDQIIYNKGIE